MECKKCGNDNIEEFDSTIVGQLGSPDAKVMRVCLCCDDRVELTEQDQKEFKEWEKENGE